MIQSEFPGYMGLHGPAVLRQYWAFEIELLWAISITNRLRVALMIHRPSIFQEEKNPKENSILWLLWCLFAIERWTPVFVTLQQKAKLFLPPTGNSAVKCLMNIEYPTLQELTVNLLTHDFEVDYESEENAQIVYSALAVDKELQPDKVKRQMTVSNGKLVVHFEAVEARFLRASFSAFVDVLTLATKTIEEFGQGMEL
ncbi:hypothetical protein RHSIM_Rhsim03G0209800 [Rhododendron simsii]|uniref:Uncharacterized protein n=1 Tax=Rhododendron simsii TaxID=118357 RepID=A0A834LTL5_RHOSS|nr:hypothetical protein RHSIM_Rhsim03G0210000 [Rhododendron simsii]KAF7148215.1 hypothetical protein RHSIM_Rhsim03G0209800 [Rhododendron simsii]